MPLQPAELLEMRVGKPEPTEADVLETYYSQEELASPPLRVHYEPAKQERAVAQLVSLIYVLPAFAAAAKCVGFIDPVTRAISAGELSECFSAEEFITWARANAITWPDQLKRAIRELDEIHNLKTRCDSLTRERDELLAKLEESAKREKDNPRIVRTLYRILGAMIKKAPYSFNSKRARNDATKAIWHALDDVRVTMEQDTILTHLRKAEQEISSSRDD